MNIAGFGNLFACYRERRPLLGGVYVLVPIWLGAPRPAWPPKSLMKRGLPGFLGRYLVTVKKTPEAPYTTKVNYRKPTSRGTTPQRSRRGVQAAHWRPVLRRVSAPVASVRQPC